jgi:hypothetical protein
MMQPLFLFFFNFFFTKKHRKIIIIFHILIQNKKHKTLIIKYLNLQTIIKYRKKCFTMANFCLCQPVNITTYLYHQKRISECGERNLIN